MTITVVDASQTTDNPADDEEAEEFSFNYKASDISKTATSITITVKNITGTATELWFWANTDGDKGDSIVHKSGEGADAVYELTIKDATKIAYLKEKGIVIKGAKGLNAEVKVTTTEPTATSPTDGEDEEKEDNETPTMPTAITLIDFESNNYEATKHETNMTKSATDGIWTCKLTVSKQWIDFQVKATIGGKTIWYKGASGGKEVTLGSAPATMSTGEEGDKDNLYCNIGKKYNGAEISVTVDFTGTEPSIKIKLDKEGTEATTGGDEEDGTPIKSEIVTMESSPIEFVSATTLSALNISSLTVTATDASYTGDSKDAWSFKIYSSTNWENKTELEWSDDIDGHKKTISGDDLANFKSSGIFVYGWPTDISAKITVTYK